jgi:hypothetical protein
LQLSESEILDWGSMALFSPNGPWQAREAALRQAAVPNLTIWRRVRATLVVRCVWYGVEWGD